MSGLGDKSRGRCSFTLIPLSNIFTVNIEAKSSCICFGVFASTRESMKYVVDCFVLHTGIFYVKCSATLTVICAITLSQNTFLFEFWNVEWISWWINKWISLNGHECLPILNATGWTALWCWLYNVFLVWIFIQFLLRSFV